MIRLPPRLHRQLSRGFPDTFRLTRLAIIGFMPSNVGCSPTSGFDSAPVHKLANTSARGAGEWYFLRTITIVALAVRQANPKHRKKQAGTCRWPTASFTAPGTDVGIAYGQFW